MHGKAGSRPRRARDDAVSAVLGGVLMLALMLTMVPGAIMLKQAMSDEMAAQREAAQRAAFCARNPRGAGCEEMGPLPGYRCEMAAKDVFVCVPASVDAATLPTLVELPEALGPPEMPRHFAT